MSRPRLHPLPASAFTVAALTAGLSLAGGAPAAADHPPQWRSPVTPLHVQRGFDPPEHDWLPGHRGVDLRAHPGDTVRAAGDGRVTYAGDLAGRGVVVIDHGTVRTTYQPVAASVQVGEHVRAGDAVGTVTPGAGHCGDGDCLHLGLRRGRTYLDPMLLLAGAVAVLRPW